MPDWPSHVSWRQRCRCYLVEQWLEAMIVLAIDHDDIDGCSSQCLGGVQATEACTDDHHLWSLLRHCIFPSVCSRSWGWNIKQAKRRDRRVGHTKCQQTNCGQQGIFLGKLCCRIEKVKSRKISAFDAALSFDAVKHVKVYRTSVVAHWPQW